MAVRKKSGGTQKHFGGSGTTGLAVRGGGSRTVTVKGKTNTQSKTNTKEHSNEVETSPLPVVFQGQGYTLGGSSSKVSKLLNQSSSSNLQLPSSSSESNKPKVDHSKRENSKCPNKEKVFCKSVSQTEGNSTHGKQKSMDCYVVSPSPSQPARKTVRCPVCDASVPEKDINKHLDECVTNHSDDEVVQNQNENDTQETSYSDILPPASQEVVCSGGSECCNIDSGQISEASGSRCNRDDLTELYPCPVCGEGCSPSTINNHLDSHF